MATITLRSVKGLPLTNTELDDNFSNLNSNKAELVSPTFTTPNLGVASGTSFNSITGLSSTTPIVDGVAAIGSATTAARADHVHPSSAVSGGDAANNIGYLNVPQQSKSAAYTAVLTDSGKHILHPSADTTARVFTIPSNSSVAFPVGTALTFVNQASAGVVSIACSEIMRLAGAGTTGTRSLAANGIATALKITATEWIISGTGLT